MYEKFQLRDGELMSEYEVCPFPLQTLGLNSIWHILY